MGISIAWELTAPKFLFSTNGAAFLRLLYPGNQLIAKINCKFGFFVSVSAINATTVEVTFNNEVDATKVITSNFTILDKNSAPVAGGVTKALLSDDKKKVTLTVGALSAAGQPYTLFINKNEFALENNQLAIDLSVTVPAVSEVKVDSKTQITVDFDKDIAADASLSATSVTITDLTDSTLTHTVGTTPTVADGNLVVAFTGDLVVGHNYKVTVAKDAVVDSFGTKNEEIEKSFTFVTNEVVPAASSVAFVKSVSGDIDAIVTFNIPVAAVDSTVNVQVQDRTAFVTNSLTGLSVLDSKATAAAQEARVAGLKLESNQLLIQDITGLIAGNEYGIVLAANEVKDTTVAALKNEATTATSTFNIDVDAPEVTASELVSATEIKLTMSEAVTYDATKEVKVAGFNATGAADEVVAAVTVSIDGKTVTLKPKTAGELFSTEAVSANTLDIAAGAFKDASDNASAVVASDFADATDKAAPVVVSTELNAGVITVTFTEGVAASADAASKKILVDGVVYGYNATAASGKWTVSGNNVVITGGADNSQVVIAAGAVKDQATTANLNAQATVKAKEVTPAPAPNTDPTITFAAGVTDETVNVDDPVTAPSAADVEVADAEDDVADLVVDVVITDADDAVVSSIDTSAPGVYTVTYTVTDSEGATKSVSRTITVSGV